MDTEYSVLVTETVCIPSKESSTALWTKFSVISTNFIFRLKIFDEAELQHNVNRVGRYEMILRTSKFRIQFSASARNRLQCSDGYLKT